MKRHLNTLYITTEKCVLKKERETIVIMQGKATLARFPVHGIESVVCFGLSRVTPKLMQFCAESKITISFLSPYGRFYARVTGPQSGNVLLRKEQYRISDNKEKSILYAKQFLRGKLFNSKSILSRHIRNYPGDKNKTQIESVVTYFENFDSKVSEHINLDVLRGEEGLAAKLYFSVFNNFIRSDSSFFNFSVRSKHPPLDPVNCMLSFLYTLLMHDVRSALEVTGLDPYVGFLHRDRPGRASLALDLMEEFRSYWVDRMVLALINRKQVTYNDFELLDSGIVIMKESLKKLLIKTYQERKQKVIYHPILKEKLTLGKVPFIQAMLLARVVRNDMPEYPPLLVS